MSDISNHTTLTQLLSKSTFEVSEVAKNSALYQIMVLFIFLLQLSPQMKTFLSREIISCHQGALSSSALNNSDPFIFLSQTILLVFMGNVFLSVPNILPLWWWNCIYKGRRRGFLSYTSVYGLKPNQLDWMFNTIHIYKFLNPVGIFVKCVHECPKFIVSKVSE